MKAAVLMLCFLSTVASADITYTWCVTSTVRNGNTSYTLRCEFAHAYYESRYLTWVKTFCTDRLNEVPFGTETYWYKHILPQTDVSNHHWTNYFAVPCWLDHYTLYSYIETQGRFDGVITRGVKQYTWDRGFLRACNAP